MSKREYVTRFSYRGSNELARYGRDVLVQSGVTVAGIWIPLGRKRYGYEEIAAMRGPTGVGVFTGYAWGDDHEAAYQASLAERPTVQKERSMTDRASLIPLRYLRPSWWVRNTRWRLGRVTPLRGPGMTDLMVSPESIDEFLAKYPPDTPQTIRGCEWCGQPSLSGPLCRACADLSAEGFDGPEDVTL